MWSGDMAYATGLMATDGNLSMDGRHLELTSKDLDQIENFLACIDRTAKITKKTSGFTGKEVNRVQFSDVGLYSFLVSVGLTPNKTKSLGEIKVPDEFFFDFLRGHHDGDGSFHSYYDPRWKKSFMFYLSFISASPLHINWLQKRIEELVGAKGHVSKSKTSTILQLKYAKKEGLMILERMYANPSSTHLVRKRLKIETALRIVGQSLPGSGYVPR